MSEENPRRAWRVLPRNLSRKWRLVLVAGLAAVALAAAPVVVQAEPTGEAEASDVDVQARPKFQLPFPCNQVWSGQTRTDHSPANAVDFNRTNDSGDPVVASAPGKVSRVGNTGGDSYGRYVYIDHGGGWETRYAHLSSQSVSVGTSVSYGTKIGEVGTTGGSTGPHLHYEQRAGGDDVKAYFNGSQAHYWGSKNYTSRNCGGNPYTPEQICGNSYKQIDSKALTSSGKTVGRIYLMYNSSNGYNCVATLKLVSLGTASSASATLQAQGGTKGSDSGKFSYYAGPVKKQAPKTCVKWGGSVGSASWESGWSHCG
ncbi:MAG: M23 family metallopeptidase [Stackebrandtia sp.]